MNPCTQSDIMTLAQDEDMVHPFEYACIIGIFHLEVVHNIPGASAVPVLMEVLWVHRFQHDTCHAAGFKKKQLHWVEYIPETDLDAFGFINPDEVIHGAHLIPVFNYSATKDLLQGESIAREADEQDDYQYFYVNMYASIPVSDGLKLILLQALLTGICTCNTMGEELDTTKCPSMISTVLLSKPMLAPLAKFKHLKLNLTILINR
jgi:hypothetical protein